MSSTFVGFGFGAIQGGLFLYEAFKTQKFDRLVVAEVNRDLVKAIREGQGQFYVNIATRTGRIIAEIDGVEVYNPLDQVDRQKLVTAVAEASEMATALPSVQFYSLGLAPAADILGEGLFLKSRNGGLPGAVVYAAENNNRAAEILLDEVEQRAGINKEELNGCVQVLNTVIGKMSGVVSEEQRIAKESLRKITGAGTSAYLVEEFNHILISKVKQGFNRHISVFIEKDNLLPFEEAKLFGHNAAHALLGFLCLEAGLEYISEASQTEELINFTRDAFLKESGGALIKKWTGVDQLFTVDGYRDYAEDLIERMINPFLHDTVERVTRDPLRKLEWDDRFIGTIRCALSQGLIPWRFARGVSLALNFLREKSGDEVVNGIIKGWRTSACNESQLDQVLSLVGV